MWKSRLRQLLKTQTLRDSAASFLGHNTAALGGAVFFALGFRLLGKEAFGIVSLSLATAAILKDISGPALNATLLRLVPHQPDPKIAQGYLHYAARLLTHFYLVVAAVTLVFFHYLSLLIFKQSDFILMLLTVVTAVGYSAGFLVTGILHSRRLFYHEAFYTFSLSLLRLTLLGLVFFFSQVTIASLLLVNLGAYFIGSLIAFSFIKLKFLQAPVTPQIKATTHKFLLPMAASTATGTVTDKANLYITNYFASLAQVGLLGAVMRLFIPVQQFAGVVSSVFGSRFSGYPDLPQAQEYLRKTAYGASALALGLLATTAVARPIGLAIYGPDFAEAIPVFRLLIVAFSFFVFQVPFSGFLLYFKGRSDLMAKITLFQLLLSVAANLVLIPLRGILGAALALLLAHLVNALVIVIVSQKAAAKPA